MEPCLEHYNFFNKHSIDQVNNVLETQVFAIQYTKILNIDFWFKVLPKISKMEKLELYEYETLSIYIP